MVRMVLDLMELLDLIELGKGRVRAQPWCQVMARKAVLMEHALHQGLSGAWPWQVRAGVQPWTGHGKQNYHGNRDLPASSGVPPRGSCKTQIIASNTAPSWQDYEGSRRPLRGPGVGSSATQIHKHFNPGSIATP